jgi:peptidyl-prolyl cis-trans isomerase SurA
MKKIFNFIVLCLSLSALMVLPSALAQLVFGPDSETKGNQLDVIVAVVNDDIISRSELDKALTALERQLRLRGTPLPASDALENQVLERLILTKLQERAAQSNGIVVDDQTLNAAIENLARQNNLSLTQLRETIEKDGFDFASFREDIRREIMTTRLRQKVVDSQIQISEQEVDNLLSSNRAIAGANEYHIAQILIALSEGASPEKIEASRDKGLQILDQLRQGADFKRLAVSFSDDTQALNGGDLGWRRADQIPTLFADIVTRLQPGEFSELIRSPIGFHIIKLLEVKGSSPGQVTQTHVRHILIIANERIPDEDARLRLERLYERIQNGADFAELARANSNDAISAVKGGDLGWVNPGDLPPLFQQEIDKLQPGQLSQPFKTPLGWHIVQVLERRQSDSSGENQRTQIREALFKRRSEEEWEMWLRHLRDEAYVEIRLNQAPAKQDTPSGDHS